MASAPTRAMGKFERLARERQARDIETGAARGLQWDPAAAERPIEFIEGLCKHHKGEWAGKPLLLEEWEKFSIRCVFGWKRADGLRRFRTAWLEVARKNGKTEIAAALGLYLETADDEAGAEVYSTATKKEQARIVWETAAAMVKASPDLSRFLRVMRGTISCARLGSKFEPLSADSGTLDGLNPHAHIPDEVHAHKDPRVWSVMDTAMGARRQPLTLAITTAGIYDTEAIGWQQHEYATQVLGGAIEDDSFFAFIAAADEGDDYFSVSAQQKANPNYGVSVKPDYLARQAAKAQVQPSFLNEYFRLHLNIWTQQITRWLPLKQWKACFVRDLDEQSLEGRVCVGGLDMARKIDLAAFVLAFEVDGGGIDFLALFWLPEAKIREEATKGRHHYEQWVRDGWLIETPGDVIDDDRIRADIRDLGKRFSIREIAYDEWSARELSIKLRDDDGFQMIETGQGYKSMSEPSKKLEALTVSRKIRYRSPVLHWCGLNAAVATDPAGNIKPTKEKSVNKIDGIVAAVMALSRIVDPAESETSFYETRGL